MLATPLSAKSEYFDAPGSPMADATSNPYEHEQSINEGTGMNGNGVQSADYGYEGGAGGGGADVMRQPSVAVHPNGLGNGNGVVEEETATGSTTANGYPADLKQHLDSTDPTTTTTTTTTTGTGTGATPPLPPRAASPISATTTNAPPPLPPRELGDDQTSIATGPSVSPSAAAARAPSPTTSANAADPQSPTIDSTTAPRSFAAGAGTTGPLATAQPNSSLHTRAATAESTLGKKELGKIERVEKKEAKRLSKIMKSEAKVEKEALDAAIREMERLQKVQRDAVKAESKAVAAHTKALTKARKPEKRFLAAKAAHEQAQTLIHSQHELMEASKKRAAEATALLQRQAAEVGRLREVKGADDRERQQRLNELAA